MAQKDSEVANTFKTWLIITEGTLAKSPLLTYLDVFVPASADDDRVLGVGRESDA